MDDCLHAVGWCHCEPQVAPEPLLCAHRLPVHSWEPGEACPPQRVAPEPERQLDDLDAAPAETQVSIEVHEALLAETLVLADALDDVSAAVERAERRVATLRAERKVRPAPRDAEPERCPTCVTSDRRECAHDGFVHPHSGTKGCCPDPWHRPASLVEGEQAYDPDLDVDPMHTEDFYNGDDQ